MSTDIFINRHKNESAIKGSMNYIIIKNAKEICKKEIENGKYCNLHKHMCENIIKANSIEDILNVFGYEYEKELVDDEVLYKLEYDGVLNCEDAMYEILAHAMTDGYIEYEYLDDGSKFYYIIKDGVSTYSNKI